MITSISLVKLHHYTIFLCVITFYDLLSATSKYTIQYCFYWFDYLIIKCPSLFLVTISALKCNCLVLLDTVTLFCLLPSYYSTFSPLKLFCDFDSKYRICLPCRQHSFCLTGAANLKLWCILLIRKDLHLLFYYLFYILGLFCSFS